MICPGKIFLANGAGSDFEKNRFEDVHSPQKKQAGPGQILRQIDLKTSITTKFKPTVNRQLVAVVVVFVVGMVGDVVVVVVVVVVNVVVVVVVVESCGAAAERVQGAGACQHGMGMCNGEAAT